MRTPPAISGVESGGEIFLPFLFVDDLSLSVRCSDDFLLPDPLPLSALCRSGAAPSSLDAALFLL